jgi:Ca-activated chloride channel homolog
MRKVIVFLLFIQIQCLYAAGVAVIDACTNDLVKSATCDIDIDISNQVALVTTSQLFINDRDHAVEIKYAFPLPEKASATRLRYWLHDTWLEAKLTASPPDTTLPGSGGSGGSVHWQLDDYLGDTPFYFEIDQSLEPHDSLEIKLQYVQLLIQSHGEVGMVYPGGLDVVQSAVLERISVQANIESQQTVSDATIEPYQPTDLIQLGNSVSLSWQGSQLPQDLTVRYTVTSDELAMFGLATRIPDAQLPDPWGGFFLVGVVPPISEQVTSIGKRFTFIIDCSGSMTGNKIVQARKAARYIINHLNPQDWFNIVTFSSSTRTLFDTHKPADSDFRYRAQTFIDQQVKASGSTNIGAAFGTAIDDYRWSSDEQANIIIFMTDGLPTAGIKNTDDLCSYISGESQSLDAPLSVFCFGIGHDVNKQLLTRIADNHQGKAMFIADQEVEPRISALYKNVCNPVILDAQLSFDRDDVIQVYPQTISNLYQGQQVLITGRYQHSGPLHLQLNGQAFGQPVQYDFSLTLPDTLDPQYHFLPQVWAKQKIEQMLVDYYLLEPYTSKAQTIKQQIIEFSISYGIASPFTSFTPPATGVEEELDTESGQRVARPEIAELLGNHPNPFNPGTTIQFRVHEMLTRTVEIRIYNAMGQLVRTLTLEVSRTGMFSVRWDGRNDQGMALPSGVYLYVIDLGEMQLAGKMSMQK